jgi:hypothetical protein
VGRTGSGSCAVADSTISGAEPSGSATREFRGTGYEDGRWIELAHDPIQWRALPLALSNPRTPVLESRLGLLLELSVPWLSAELRVSICPNSPSDRVTVKTGLCQNIARRVSVSCGVSQLQKEENKLGSLKCRLSLIRICSHDLAECIRWIKKQDR